MTMLRHATWGPYYWPWALITIGLIILIPEVYALITNVMNTLSWYSWTELHVRPVTPFSKHSAAWLLSQGTFLVLVIWLWWHIWYAYFR